MKTIQIQVDDTTYSKLQRLAHDMGTPRSSVRTLLELYLFRKSPSQPGIPMYPEERTEIETLLKIGKHEPTAATDAKTSAISKGESTGNAKKGKRSDKPKKSSPDAGRTEH